MKITEEQLGGHIKRIMTEKENQAKFKNETFSGLTVEEIASELSKRLGAGWELEGKCIST